MSETKESIPLFKVFMSPSVMEPLSKTVLSGYIAQGPVVEEFEAGLRSYMENQRIVTVNAATSGLHLALRLLNKEIRETDGYSGAINVLSCPQTCTATNFPIPENGYGIKWVDIDPRNCNINLRDLFKKIDQTTRIIMLVHWSGYPIDLDMVSDIQEYCKIKHNFMPWIIQDCAHAFGVKYHGTTLANSVNTLLHDRSICVFSTQAIKHLTTGDGGFMVLPTDELYRRAKLLRWYGISRDGPKNVKDYRIEQDVPEYGYKFHMNDINATIGLYNLPCVQKNIEHARDIAQYYNSHITNPLVTLLEYNEHTHEAGWWIYSMRIQFKYNFIQYMDSKGIVTSQVHKRNDGHSCLAQYAATLPILDEFEKELVCIPIGWWITDEQKEYIVAAVNEFQDPSPATKTSTEITN
jgi:dTDP-4-amino-4,6-dideoxygalactose transaminase